MQHVRARVMIQCLFSPNGASPVAIAHGMPEKEVGGNKCQNEWQPALSHGARAERLPGCCARLSCLVTGLLLLSFLSPYHHGASMAPSLLIFSVFPLFSLLLVFFNLLFTLLKLSLSLLSFLTLASFIGFVREAGGRPSRHVPKLRRRFVSLPLPFRSGFKSSAFPNIKLHRPIQSSWSDTHDGRARVPVHQYQYTVQYVHSCSESDNDHCRCTSTTPLASCCPLTRSLLHPIVPVSLASGPEFIVGATRQSIGTPPLCARGPASLTRESTPQ
jgi:hypothetical protein